MHAGTVNPSRTPPDLVATEAAELGALQEIVTLAAGAATWDELMQLIVDRSTVAMDAEVCSLYLVDRDGAGLTLAATNGVDREHIGVARLDIGQGITGLAASTRGPVVSTDLANDPRCAWIRGVDHERFTSILAVPLEVGDRVVGVLNVKTEERREFDPPQVRRLSTIASLLAGVVERRRLHLETEAQLDGLRSVDQARAELIAVVTHQLRTPLAVVRAYLDLLAETRTEARRVRRLARCTDRTAPALTTVRHILDTVRAARLLTVERAVSSLDRESTVLTRLAPLLRRHRLEPTPRQRPALGDPAACPVLELLLANAANYVRRDRYRVADCLRRRGALAVGAMSWSLHRCRSVFEPSCASTPVPTARTVSALRGARLVSAMGGRCGSRQAGGGSQFVTRCRSRPTVACDPRDRRRAGHDRCRGGPLRSVGLA